MASDATLTVCADPAALADTAANLIIDVATEAVRERGRFMLCLAGGETPRKTYERLALPAFSERVSWDRTWAFFGDERVVPPGHAESNYRMANETLLSRVPIPPAQILRMRGEHDPAARVLDEALASATVRADRAELLCERSSVHAAAGADALATSDLGAALASGSIEAGLRLAARALADGEPSRARSLYRSSTDASATRPSAWRGYGLALLARNSPNPLAQD